MLADGEKRIKPGSYSVEFRRNVSSLSQGRSSHWELVIDVRIRFFEVSGDRDEVCFGAFQHMAANCPER